MEILIAVALVLAGFLLLIWSADLLVDNASALGSQLGVSTFMVGIIVVGFGTSAPELFVSAMAALQDKGNLALGNALGSNITNIGLVLGSAALVRSLPVEPSTAKIDLPIVIGTGILAIALVVDGLLSHLDGIILLTVLIAYLIWSGRNSKDADTETSVAKTSNTLSELDVNQLNHTAKKSLLSHSLLTLASIILLMIASRMLVEGAVKIAEFLGIGELIIGLTIVAIGTSLPELAAAIAAARKGMQEMIIGNIIGSNIFNTLGVLGITGVIKATDVDTGALARDFPIMFVFTVVMLVFALSKGAFSRVEGAIFISCYFGYLGYLVFITV